ncbi:glycoside hydrolase family 95-like protein, partial [Prevotella sp.]
YQIDGNFGCCAGIAEMLVQSHAGFIHILPALPLEWKKNGEVKGLCTRGGFEITDLNWTDGKVTLLKIKSKVGGNLRLRTATPLKMADGTSLRLADGDNTNPLMQPYRMPAPIVKDKSKIPATFLPETVLYDIPTEAGQEIVLVCRN